jgi:NAD-dependent DNA ligase
MSFVDEQGQPIRAFNKEIITDRQIDELIGICRGVGADEIVTQKEAEYLIQWLQEHREAADTYPMNILYRRLSEMLSDGILDEEESRELLDIIKQLTGENKLELTGQTASSDLPLDRPAPDVTIAGSNFVFTGVFTIGTRKKCEEIVDSLGGKVQKRVTHATNYLVVGDIGSEHWVHSTHGRKIEKALEYKNAGDDIAIISENHWIKYI